MPRGLEMKRLRYCPKFSDQLAVFSLCMQFVYILQTKTANFKLRLPTANCD